MKALIFAAGLGERMRPLTEHTPKPLLVAGGKPLIEWHLEKLAAAGITDVVINTSWLADQFPQALGDGSRWGVRLQYAYEGPTPLETGGGMLQAMQQLARDVDATTATDTLLAINGDIWTDYDFALLPESPAGDAHLVLVENPGHNPAGDFMLDDGAVRSDGATRLTFAGIGVYRPALFDGWHDVIGDAPGATRMPPRFRLTPLLRAAMARGAVSGEQHRGQWTDVGTPARLAQLDAQLGPGAD